MNRYTCLNPSGGRCGDCEGCLRDERDRLREALAEIHEYHCGCAQPGRLDLCVAQPVVLFDFTRGETTFQRPGGDEDGDS